MPPARAALSLPPDGRQSDAALAICLGTRRLLASLGFSSLTEVTLANGRRADVMGLGPGGEIWIVEVKSSVADFRADGKWPEYRDFCDRLFFAVDPDFPTAILPDAAGLIVADAYGAAILREAPEDRLPGARRKAVILRLAHAAAGRLHLLADPQGAGGRMG